MLRRKNPEHPFHPPQTNHSPYRFERKNLNLSPGVSPGLSPMRCRTPTRGNVSPFRIGNNNENYRAGHSPIKFVTSKLTLQNNQQNKGFFRTQNHPNYQPQYTQKYTSANPNNNHSVKRQSFYENPGSSKINNATYENSERTMLHENTKLFSKLVEKINSEKKKQPEMVKRNTKPETYKAQEVSQNEVKPYSNVQKLTKVKSQTQNVKIETINEHIKPVESVVYEERQTRAYTYQHQVSNYATYTVNGKENREVENEHTYKLRQKGNGHSGGLETNKSNNKSSTPSRRDQEVQREKSLKREAERKQKEQRQQMASNLNQNGQGGQVSLNKGKLMEEAKKVQKSDEIDDFAELDMLLGKVKNLSKPVPQEVKQSISNVSQASNVQSSINMDPYL